MKHITICFDLDGTLFDLYGKKNWLEMLKAENPNAFEGDFLPEIDKDDLYFFMKKLANRNVRFEVVTWLPKFASAEYEQKCAEKKRKWVKKNLPFIANVSCQSYGTPKQKAIIKKASKMYLIDDSEEVGKMWETKTQRKFVKVSKDFTVVNALENILTKLEKEE